MPATDQPNILFIISDEHDPSVTGCYGDPIVRTPHLDKLAAGGTTFTAAYTTSPLCVPARLSFLAGQYPSKCGAWNNECWLPSDKYPSLPRVLGNAGYDCVLGGKMHLDPTRRYGYRSLFHTAQNERYKDGTGFRRDPDDETPGHGPWTRRSEEFYTSPDSHYLDLDREVTEKCSEFIRSRSEADSPFFLTAGYFAPHFPLIVPPEYFQLYENALDLPDVPEDFFERLPRNYQQLYYAFGLSEVTPETTRRGRALYWAYVSWLDNEIGKLLAALAESAVARNTIVIYTSDHGENKGDHGLWWKNCMYDHATRIPLIISRPDDTRLGHSVDSVCSLVDLTKAIAEMGGARVPSYWDGESLLRCLEENGRPWKDTAVSEYYGHNISSGFAMIRRGPMKYVYHTRINDTYGPEIELYDLIRDPAEMSNLAHLAENEQVIAEMHRMLCDELGRDPEDAEAQCRQDLATGYKRADKPT